LVLSSRFIPILVALLLQFFIKLLGVAQSLYCKQALINLNKSNDRVVADLRGSVQMNRVGRGSTRIQPPDPPMADSEAPRVFVSR
jgi:hypothetical protein